MNTGQLLSKAMCDLDEMILLLEDVNPILGITDEGFKAAINLFIVVMSEKIALAEFMQRVPIAERLENSDRFCNDVIELVRDYTGIDLFERCNASPS